MSILHWLCLMVVALSCLARTARASICDPPAHSRQPCQCDRLWASVKCSCLGGASNHSELLIANEGIHKLPPTVVEIDISHCARVHIASKALEPLYSLWSLRISNVESLHLESYSFSWNQTTILESYPQRGIDIRITNATIFEMPNYTFKGRIENIYFGGVNVRSIRSFAFTSLAGTNAIDIRDTTFHGIETQAFKKFIAQKLHLKNVDFLQPLASRTMNDIRISKEFILEDVKFDAIRSLAFIIHGPETFSISKCYAKLIQSEAFSVRVRGTVIIDDNEFGTLEVAAFGAIRTEDSFQNSDDVRPLIFENNTISHYVSDSLVFNISSFEPKIDWIYANETCECYRMNTLFSSLVTYSRNYPYDKTKPSAPMGDVIYCKNEGKYVRIGQFRDNICQATTSSTSKWMIFFLIIMIFVSITILSFAIWKKKRTRWDRVPTSDTLALKSPVKRGKHRTVVVPDGKTYKETELQVIVECAEPIKEFSNNQAFGTNQYTSRVRRPNAKTELLTSDL